MSTAQTEKIASQSVATFFASQKPPLAEVVAAIGVAVCRSLKDAQNAGKPLGKIALDTVRIDRTGVPIVLTLHDSGAESEDTRAVLFSLGVFLYRIATGAPPAVLQNENCASVVERDPSLGRPLSLAIDRLMTTESEEGFASVHEASNALLAILRHGGVENSDGLLDKYFSDPLRTSLEFHATVVRGNLLVAQDMIGKGRGEAGLELATRIVYLDEGNAQAQALMDTVTRQSSRKWISIVGPFLATALVGVVFWGSRPGAISNGIVIPDAGIATTEDTTSPETVGDLQPDSSTLTLSVQLQDSNRVRISGKQIANGGTVELAAGRHEIEFFIDSQSSGTVRVLELLENCTLRDTPTVGCFAL